MIRNALLIAFHSLMIALFATSSELCAAEASSRFSDEPVPLQLDDFPERPAPLFEIGDGFLSTGNISDGFTLPTGAVWAPSFFMFGNYRTAIQTFDNGTTRTSEWANDLNLFGNLQLAATERIVIGLSPLRNRDGEFTGYTFEPNRIRGRDEDFGNNFEPSIFYFEGEFGELFPRWDRGDRRSLDYGISIGRQPLRLQDGILVNDDRLDAITITRNALLPGRGSNLKLSGIFAWDEIQRGDNRTDDSARLFGLDMLMDLPRSTIEADILYTTADDGEDGFYAGIGATQRMGKFATTFRVNQSVAVEEESAAVRTGTLFFAEVSIEPPHTHNNLYVNGYVAIDGFTSAVRGPFTGGPIGRAGVLFSAVGIGRYGSPLSDRAIRSAGGAIGYQMFFGEFRRRQLILEAGGLASTDEGSSAEAVGARFQQALGRRSVLRFDLFGALQESTDDAYGARMELLVKF
jgi:hypothetical protein